jgi:hypothetical protein
VSILDVSNREQARSHARPCDYIADRKPERIIRDVYRQWGEDEHELSLAFHLVNP